MYQSTGGACTENTNSLGTEPNCPLSEGLSSAAVCAAPHCKMPGKASLVVPKPKPELRSHEKRSDSTSATAKTALQFLWT